MRRKVAAAVAVKAGSSHATPYEPNASQAVICQTLADALELADVERIETHELAGRLGLDVPDLAVPGAPQPPPGPFGEQPHRLDRLLLEHGHAGSSGRQSQRGAESAARCWARPGTARSGPDGPRFGRTPRSPH